MARNMVQRKPKRPLRTKPLGLVTTRRWLVSKRRMATTTISAKRKTRCRRMAVSILRERARMKLRRRNMWKARTRPWPTMPWRWTTRMRKQQLPPPPSLLLLLSNHGLRALAHNTQVVWGRIFLLVSSYLESCISFFGVVFFDNVWESGR
ncbi:hypothetical protein BGZ63DRAFT_383536 [Mariannaea sp. PMI_226]|nr:hypothetical protein BGZ63DRAFT_383536 [Mariannaea sp. PMI_226]